MGRRQRKPMNLFASTIEAQAATWVTLGMRVPQLMSGTMAAAERHRMVAEKAAAVAESAQATASEAGRLMLNPRSLHSPWGMINGLAALSSAAAKPFHTRVKANAKRLSKARRTPSR